MLHYVIPDRNLIKIIRKISLYRLEQICWTKGFLHVFENRYCDGLIPPNEWLCTGIGNWKVGKAQKSDDNNLVSEVQTLLNSKFRTNRNPRYVLKSMRILSIVLCIAKWNGVLVEPFLLQRAGSPLTVVFDRNEVQISPNLQAVLKIYN